VPDNTAESTDSVADKVEDFLTITELVDNVPMAYIIVALIVGVIIGAGVLLLMDDASAKKNKALEETLGGNE
jgi:hypothetical protein